MLDAIGTSSVDELFDQVPEELRLGRPLELSEGVSELEVMERLGELAAANRVSDRRCFLGGSFGLHLSPAMVSQLLLRSEFYTAYTPYQPEVAQGTLQAIFEFQTLICQLTGMDVANASLYEGASAAAEAALMALRLARGKRKRVVAAGTLDPQTREVLRTYLRWIDADLVETPVGDDGRAVFSKELFGDDLAVLLLPQVNALGLVEDLAAAAELAHGCGALLAACIADATALALLKAPGELGADIVCGEAQALGVPLSFGGPALGILATRSSFLRQLPGRLAGQTVDAEGRRGFVLTLSTREQHIRREKATSNICTNQGLMALAATIHMAALGKRGLMEVARRNALAARALRRRLAALPGVSVPFSGPIYNQVLIETARPAVEVLEAMRAQGFAAGLALSDMGQEAAWTRRFVTAVNELHRDEDLEALTQALAGVLS
jgi:glycine dehydrogenase subunit 1